MRNCCPRIKTFVICIIALIMLMRPIIVDVRASDDLFVYVGGDIIGFEVSAGGVLVTNTENCFVGEWKVSSILKKGDLIQKIDGKTVSTASEIGDALLIKKESGDIEVEFVRGGRDYKARVPIYYDKKKNKHFLGIEVKDSVAGLGTLTFALSSGEFYGLGHEIVDFDTDYRVYSTSGCLFHVDVNGISKGGTGSPGTIKGILTQKRTGLIEKCARFGIKGKITSAILDDGAVVRLGKKKDVYPGSAKICSAISGRKEYYDIKIIKAFSQASCEEKSMIIKVVDPRLLSLTGGIVQGMSGSPIIQGGKIVGAVTHVFINDSTKGYGVYVENMLQ